MNARIPKSYESLSPAEIVDVCGGIAVKQYCRYCANALDYNGESEDFLCLAAAPCGDNGAGRFYPASKAKRPNKCPHFDFLNADIFRQDENGNYAEYKPRAAYCSRNFEQLKMEIPK